MLGRGGIANSAASLFWDDQLLTTTSPVITNTMRFLQNEIICMTQYRWVKGHNGDVEECKNALRLIILK